MGLDQMMIPGQFLVGLNIVNGNWIMEQTYISQISLQMVHEKVLPKQEAQVTQTDFYYVPEEFPQLIFLEKTEPPLWI